jgi:hypothetical protein
MMGQTTRRCVALLILASGCSTSTPDPDLAAILGNPADGGRGQKPESSGDLEFDFGPILARGQTLRHIFTLTNPTERPIRLLKAMVYTPCCSAVEELPRTIPSGGEVKVPVILKPGYQSGRKRVEFAIATDAEDRPVWRLALDARLFSEWEVDPVGESGLKIPVGQAGTRTFRIVCRRKGDEGRRSPESIEAREPLQASFDGPAAEQEQPDGLVEATRDVEVSIPATEETGLRQGEILFRWSDDHRERHIVTWEVTPHIRATPSGLMIKPAGGPTTQMVSVASDDRPFRILKVVGPLLADGIETSTDPGRSHRLRLSINPAKAITGGASDIYISTDHPGQPTVTLSVLVMPAETGAVP